MSILEVEHIRKTFEQTQVLNDISFSLEKGQVVSIIGSSGSGKTTLLRCLNFLEHPDGGRILVNGETLFDASQAESQNEREIRKKRLHFGLVFQSFNLFPQYTALQNVMLAKELLAMDAPDYKADKKNIHSAIEAQAETLLTQMGLADRMHNYPHQLSGGQPKVIVADEPVSMVDVSLRIALIDLMTRMNQKYNISFVYITHDLATARYVAKDGRLAVMYLGKIVELNNIRRAIDNPKHPCFKALIAAERRVTLRLFYNTEIRAGEFHAICLDTHHDMCYIRRQS